MRIVLEFIAVFLSIIYWRKTRKVIWGGLALGLSVWFIADLILVCLSKFFAWRTILNFIADWHYVLRIIASGIVVLIAGLLGMLPNKTKNKP